MKGSWRTTAAAVAAFVSVLAAALKAQLDGDPGTIADWNAVVAFVFVLVQGLVSRDDKVSSEQAGAR